MDHYQIIAALIVKRLREEIAPEEEARLAEWADSDPANRALFEQLMDAGEFEGLLKTTYQSRIRIEQQLRERLQLERKNVRVLQWKRWAVAASILLVVGLGGYLLHENAGKPAPTAAKALISVQAPDRNRATITLGNGQVVYLDSAAVGRLTSQGNTSLVKLANGQLAYRRAGGAVPGNEIYNTLTNPRGSSVIEMALSDGTHVWLNAGSSLTYPVTFTGKERKVRLNGEGYFEVAKDPARKFAVASNGFSVEVLGTHFNINTYGGEPSKITLLEGSVVVKPAADNNSLKLEPGEQAVFPHDKTGQMELRQADIDQVMAWKNGLFRFRSEDVASIARQLGVWYNVAIVYEGASGKKVTGYISRSASLEEVLKMLEIATGIHSEYKDGTIVLR